MPLSQKPKILLSLSLLVWLLAVCLGLRFILNYENTQGINGAPPPTWPAESRIHFTPQQQPALLMFVHPRCPCSRASLNELALLMEQTNGKVQAHVLFVKPKDFSENWEKAELWDSAAKISGVELSVDVEGVEARRFNSQTSGQVMLYGADGRLRFSGGITSARGHVGDNDGRQALASLINENNSAIRETPVFGCPIFGDAPHEPLKDSCDAQNHTP